MRRRFLVAVALVSACNLNQSGNHTSSSRGDSTRQAQKGSPVSAMRDPCGEGDVMASSITRRPYLQQVTTSTATIGWVTSSPEMPAKVHVTLPDGRPVASVSGVPVGAPRGARQMWATVSGLEPKTIYCYTIAGREPLVARTGFRTAPTAEDTTPIRFLAFGDSGGGGRDQRRLRDRMLEYSYDLIVHTGDIAYNSGKLEEFEANVFGIYHQLLRNIPLFPSAGNHEYRTSDAAPFRQVFSLPGDRDPGQLWYSYDWGRVHFAALDTEASYSQQAKWLDRDLAASTAPWKIVYLHRPPYSSGKHGSDTSLRKALEPVLEKHGVQLVLAGHDHNYERVTPQRGVQHVVTGGGGKGTRQVRRSSFTEVADAVIHFVTVDVGVDELVVHAIDAAGNEFDSVVVPRGTP
jgi:hypothetical protein